MARPHICFLQSQHLLWRENGLQGMRDGCWVKVLSMDPGTKAVTAIVVYPDGFRIGRPQWLTATEEILVLSGSIKVNGKELGHHGYARWPAGYERLGFEAPHGAEVLTMFSGRALVGTGDPPDYDEHDLVDACDTWALEWKTGAEGSVTGKPLSPTIFTKKLWWNEQTGEQSFLYAALPHHPPPKVMPGKFTHPMVEELFMLEGEYSFGDVGRMGPGGYCWWREGEWHGPVGSRAGYSMFIRVHEGQLVNQFATEPSRFSYEPLHRPKVPDNIGDDQKAPFDWPKKW